MKAGEERFSVALDRKDKSVWYQISSLSKADHTLSRLTYPLVCHFQNQFISQSLRSFSKVMKKADEHVPQQNQSA